MLLKKNQYLKIKWNFKKLDIDLIINLGPDLINSET